MHDFACLLAGRPGGWKDWVGWEAWERPGGAFCIIKVAGRERLHPQIENQSMTLCYRINQFQSLVHSHCALHCMYYMNE